MVRTKTPPGLPTREQILDFIQTSDTPAGKREIARAFGLSAQQKITLKALLKDMADEGLIDSAPGRAFHKMGGVPKVTVLRIVDADEPPLRVFFGEKPLGIAEADYESRLRTWREWQPVALEAHGHQG